MMDLRTCQQTLCQALDPSASPIQLHNACRLLHETADLSGGQRLQIYRHSITGMQQRVLGMVYPVCKQVLGQACFDTLARDYAWHPRSNHSDLNGYGAGFADLLDESMQQQAALAELPYLGDLARLEWHWHQSHFAKDDETFDSDKITGLMRSAGEDLVPKVSHSLSVLVSPWPVLAIWQHHVKGDPGQTITALPERQYLLVHRQTGAVYIEPIDQDGYEFFTLSAQGSTLRQLADVLGDRAGPVFARLADFIRRGWLTGFSIRE